MSSDSTSVTKYSALPTAWPYAGELAREADERRRQPDVWACLRDPAGREHFIRRKERDAIRVLTSAAYG